MVDAPEKLWMTAEEMGWPGSFRSFRMSDLEHPEEYPAYVRADLHEQVKRELEQVKQDYDLLRIAQGGEYADTWKARAEAAEKERDDYKRKWEQACAMGQLQAEAAERLAGERVVTDAMIEAGLEYYAEGGCGGLADHERREVVEAIIEAALAGAKP